MAGRQPQPSAELARVEAGFEALSGDLTDRFRQSIPTASGLLSPDQVLTWAEDCLDLAGSAKPKSIEVATECFQATADIAGILDGARFLRWVRRGTALCRDGPDLARAYFRVSPKVLAMLPEVMREVWLELGPGLYREDRESIALASRFILAMPDLLPVLSLVEVERLALLLHRLGKTSHDLADRCLASAPHAFDGLQDGLAGAFLSVALNIVRLNAVAAADFFENGAVALSSLDGRWHKEFLGWIETVARDNARNAMSLLAACRTAFGSIENGLHSRVIDRARILSASPPALIAFLENCPAIVSAVGSAGLERWATEGVRIFRLAHDAGLAYFRIGAGDPASLERLSTRAGLDEIGAVLLLYAQALAGDEVELRSADDLPPWSFGLIQPGAATADGPTILLPPFVDRYRSEEANFAWYKVAVTHQAGHVEFASFRFSFARSPAVFPRLLSPPEENGGLSDLERLFGLFADRRLAADLFSLAEDVRVDYLVEREYAGIRGSYHDLQLESLVRRPTLERLPAREALLEAMIRVSLGGNASALPPRLHDRLRAALATLDELRSPEATVEDSAEAAHRLYEIAIAIPNIAAGEARRETVATGEDEADEAFLQEGQDNRKAPLTPGEEVDYRPIASGEFNEELLAELRQYEVEMVDGPDAQTGPPNFPLEEKIKVRDVVDGQHPASGLFVTDLPVGVPADRDAVEGEAHRSSDGISGDPVPADPEQGRSFLYDEWDYEDRRYLLNWCRVVEKPQAEGSTRFYEDTLLRNDALATRLRKQLEALAFGMRRRVNRLNDGEGIDIDAVVAAVVDRKTGHVPDTRVYWERRKTHRDVAVVLLLDMSASTDDVISKSDTREQYPEWYLDAMWQKANWRQPRVDKGLSEARRVIDVAKESLVLMTNALETIGDSYGIYGFSGHGRENVELLVVKGIDEPFSDEVKGRIGTISPRYGTRMGPAIRHATAKLNACDAKTKILFMVSDGYPQDRDYGRYGNDREYALQDTRMAFIEARRKDIVPFCLTVDVAGNDYLRRMAGDIGYEVLNDVEALSERLPALYSRLTS